MMPQDGRMTGFKESVREAERERILLKQLLAHASNYGKTPIPTIDEFLLSEIINGTLSYLGDKSGAWIYRNPKADCVNINNYIRGTGEYFETRLKENGSKLAGNVSNVLITMVKPRRVEPDLDRPYYKTDVHDFNPFHKSLNPIEFLSAEDIRLARVALEKANNSERRDITGIGAAMQPEITEDLKFIREHYQW